MAFLSCVLTGSACAADVALVHARIYPSPDSTPIIDGTVLIHNGRLTAVGSSNTVKTPRDAEILDAAGAVVMAGFWNSHVHLMSPPLLNAAKRSNAELTYELTQMLSRCS